MECCLIWPLFIRHLLLRTEHRILEHCWQIQPYSTVTRSLRRGMDWHLIDEAGLSDVGHAAGRAAFTATASDVQRKVHSTCLQMMRVT